MLPRRAISFLEFARFCARESGRDLLEWAVIAGFAGVCSLALPLSLWVLFDWSIPQRQSGEIWTLGAALFGICLTRALFEWAAHRSGLRMAIRAQSLVGPAMWNRMLQLPVNFLSGEVAAARASRIQAAVESASRAPLVGTRTILPTGVALANGGGLVLLDLRFGSAALLLASCGALLIAATHRRRVTGMQEEMETRSVLLGGVQEWLQGMAKIRLAGAEGEVTEAWRRGFQNLFRHRRKMLGMATRAHMVSAGFTAFACAILFLLSSQAEMTAGRFAALFAAFGALVASLVAIGERWPEWAALSALTRQSAPVLSAVPEAGEAKRDPGPLSGAVEAVNVHFGYTAGRTKILDSLSFSIQPGEFVAIAGVSGSGKSTILRLLLGFETPVGGGIFYDGQPLSELNLDHLRAQMGVVLQRPPLFAGDLERNISGEAALTTSELWRVAECVGLAGEIRRLPMQMQTLVSEGGANFSFGQRQRIALARALVTKPRILLLDEPVSALDGKTQAEVMESLAQQNMTRILITHRLSALARVDRVLLLSGGRVVESGPCSSLLEQKGSFFRLVQPQMQ